MAMMTDGKEGVADATAAIAGEPRETARRQARKRPHVAKRGRIGAAGLGMTAMLGMVAVMGRSGAGTDDADTPSNWTAADPSRAVLVPAGSGGVTDNTATSSGSSVASQSTSPTSSAPVVLQARPVISNPVVTSPAPRATTNGSR